MDITFLFATRKIAIAPDTPEIAADIVSHEHAIFLRVMRVDAVSGIRHFFNGFFMSLFDRILISILNGGRDRNYSAENSHQRSDKFIIPIPISISRFSYYASPKPSNFHTSPPVFSDVLPFSDNSHDDN